MSWVTNNTGKWETRVGKHKKGETGKHGSSAFRRHSGVSTFVLLPRLGPDCKIGSTQASSLCTPVTPPSTAAACYCHCCRLPPLLPPELAATAGASGRWRCWSLPPPPSTAASVNRLRLCRLLTPSPPAAPADFASRSQRRPPL